MMQALSGGSGGMSLLQLQSTKPLRSYTKLQGSTTTTISSACGSSVKQTTFPATTSTLISAADETHPTEAAASTPRPSRVMPPPAPSPRLGPAALHVPRRRSTLPRFPPSRFLSDVLHGSTVTSVVCSACGHASHSEQRFSSLSVELDDLNQFADAGTIEEVERAAYQWKLQLKQERKRKAELRKRKQATQDAASNPRMEVDEEQPAQADGECRDASESELGDTDDEEHLIHTRVQQALQHLDRARGGSRACHLIDCLRT